MRDRLKQLTAVTAFLLVAGGSLAACDEEGSSADGVGESSGETLTEANFLTEIIEAQAKAGTSHVTMEVDVAGQALTAEGDLKIGDSAADTSMSMTMDTGQGGLGSMEMRLVDEVFYLNFGPMTSNKFAKIDLTDESNPLGEQFGDIIGNLDPSKQLEEFEEAVTGFEKKGEPIKLDGVQAQPYELTVDTSKIPDAEQAGASLPESLTYTMYIGPDNLPRRMISNLPDIGGSGGGTMTINYSKWGEDVTISKPKASEITDKDLFSQLGSVPSES